MLNIAKQIAVRDLLRSCAAAGVAWALFATQAHTQAATFVVSSAANSGVGTLRQALLDANATPGRDSILFNFAGAPPFTISPTAPLPAATDPVVIDGTSQAGWTGQPVVVLSGVNAGTANGLVLVTSNSEIRGLVINRFSGNGIQIQGNDNVVAGCFLGTSAAGTAKQANTIAGVAIAPGARNRIGGTKPGDRNLISGNATGIYIAGLGASNNVVAGNYIGVDVNGAAALGNSANGVLLSAPNNVIGGGSAAERNVISGNGQSGVYLNDIGAVANRVRGNIIGLNASGTAVVSNALNGVTVYFARHNIIGGDAAGTANVISGNHERGISLIGTNAHGNRIEGNFIGTDITGRLDLGNRFAGIGLTAARSNVIGGTSVFTRNIISGNNQSGVALDSNNVANVVLGNFIGTDLTGTNALPNSFSGVTVSGGTNNIIGSVTPGCGNLISGNTMHGVFLAGGTRTWVLGNFIGVDLFGRAARPNTLNGVRIDSPGNTIGGASMAARNLISGNGSTGVLLNSAAASNNVVAGNYIGTDISGSLRVANSSSGIGLNNAPRNQIGTADVLGGNLVSGNRTNGIYLSGSSATGNRLYGNWIGLASNGYTALGNSIGGIFLYGAPTNFIGGASPGMGNIISGNANVAVSIGDAGATGNVLQGNFIGLAVDGTTALPNTWHGVELLSGAIGNIVGGTLPGEGNRIAYAMTEGYDGVRVRDGATRNVVRGNYLFGNGGSSANGLAIDVGTDGAATTGIANISAATGRYRTMLSGTFTGAANTTYTIDFYGNTAVDASGRGEGERWLGSVRVTTAGNGSADFSLVLTNAAGTGGWLCAAATDATGATFEFSTSAVVTAAGDSDADGLPDDYEQAFGLNPTLAADRNFDTDGDGASNRAEFVAGTRPNDAASVLRLRLIPQVKGCVEFESVPGRTYALEGALHINSYWGSVSGTIVGHGGRVRLVDQTAAGVFYRLRVN
jgi:hypothetical protein